MNYALELFLTAVSTILGIIIVFTIIAKIIGSKEEETEL